MTHDRPDRSQSDDMTKADRHNLERLARKRAKVAKSTIGERVKALRAEIEDQLAAEYEYDDALWVDLNREAQRAVVKADQAIAAKCAALGIPEELRPRINISWSGRGGNAVASRRTELRRLAYARIDSAAETAAVEIERNLLDVETELIRDGLESADALAFVEAMPTIEQLLPPVAVAALSDGGWDTDDDDDDDLARYRRRQWEPPTDAVASLLTPTSASSREAKRLAIAAALASNPDASNREIARVAGVDHHTVGKLRGESPGISPVADGDSPADTGES